MAITEETKEAYIMRASQLIARAEQDANHAKLDASQIAHWLIARKDGYSKSTWRQYRVALVYVFNQHIASGVGKPDDLSIAIERLQKTLPPAGRPSQRKTSAQKQKKISEADLIKLIKHILHKEPRYGQETVFWLLSGLWTGLRPDEWQSAVITENNELKCLNAKATQGRAHGQYRLINLAALDGSKKEDITLHLKHVHQAMLDPVKKGKSGFEQFYNHCRSCLYYATRELWPNRKKYITLYSARHQFSADAKFDGQSKEEIAALMGHASIETATIHYGRRSAGRGGFQVSANNQDVERVKVLNQHRMNTGHSSMGI